MSFKPAMKEVGFVKGSLYGPPGTGKTTEMAMLLIYLSKTYHNCAPVAWLASEKGVDFVIDMFKTEGVPLLLSRSRSFVDLRTATREALKERACAVGVDSITHFWQELFTAGMKGSGPRLQKIMRIKEEWAPFSHDFQDSPIHFLVTGRLGFQWEETEVEDGKGGVTKELSRGGTKIKAEGDFGHEPDLEIEMSAVEDPDFIRYEKVKGKARRNFKSQSIHVATIKKCRVWALNGKAFSWKDLPVYKPGYYKAVGECFKPHFDAINIGGAQGHHVTEEGRPTSDVLFEAGEESSYYEQRIQRDILLEKWDGAIALIAGGQTKESITRRAIIGRNITGTLSKTEFERQPFLDIERQVLTLLVLEKLIKQMPPKDEDALIDLITAAQNTVQDHPGADLTLLEAMQGKTTEEQAAMHDPF